MGKIRTRVLGLEEVEKKQKAEQKQRSNEKKRIRSVDADEKSLEKMEKAKKIIEASAVRPKKEKEEVKKVTVNVRGKNYQKAKKLIDKTKTYSLKEAIELLKKAKYANFDESVELHLVVDAEGLKGEADLPHTTGKTTRVKIVDEKVLADIEKGKLDFDILITHPSFMPKLAKFARVLGPKGLMPNPKAGTISTNPQEVAKKFEKGALRWKTEAKAPLIHQMIGKISFPTKDLEENARAFLLSVGRNHTLKAFIKTTMSPSVKLNLDK